MFFFKLGSLLYTDKLNNNYNKNINSNSVDNRNNNSRSNNKNNNNNKSSSNNSNSDGRNNNNNSSGNSKHICSSSSHNCSSSGSINISYDNNNNSNSNNNNSDSRYNKNNNNNNSSVNNSIINSSSNNSSSNNNNNNTSNKTVLTVNLSSVQFSDTDILLLDKGLTFVPVPKTLPISSVLESRDRLIRSIKLRAFFSKSSKPLDQKTRLFQDKSNWTPSLALLPDEIVSTIKHIDNSTVELIRNNRKVVRNNECYLKLKDKSNITLEEFNSINKFRNNRNIIIKSADKGGATVVMDLDNYIYEANRQLNDSKYYKILEQPIFYDNIPKIRSILLSMRNQGYINSKQLEYLSGPLKPRHRIFYLLPKIHKDRNKWTIPEKMPEGRPIVSDVESESYRVSQLLDHCLTPLATKHTTYLKNTYDFIDKIRHKIVDEHCFIVTGDVSALYTNMMHDRTIACVKEIFEKYPDPARPDKHLIDLLNVTLKNNDFQFNGKHYLQTCGTPMGKVYAPALANIYMLEFDEKAMTGFRIKPYLFFRYLDDVFFIWIGSKSELLEYENYLNSLIPGIKITLEYNELSANFLDTTVYKKTINNITTLQTRVYFKPTDTHQLLHVHSFHPKHTCKDANYVITLTTGTHCLNQCRTK